MNDRVAAAWWSKAILIGAIFGAVLLPIAAFGTRLGVWPFQIGLLLLVSGGALAAAAVVLGIVALIVATRQQRRADRGLLYISLIVAGVTAGFMGMQINAARSVPPIHDISTDTVDPPQFGETVIAMRGKRSNPLDYDAAKLAPQQKSAYPKVEPIETPLDPAESIDRSVDVLKDMGLTIDDVDRDAGRVEATATSFWFGFKDDVVVRVRPTADGSVIDVRSTSRVGQSDIGVNAKRIEAFIARFNAA